MTKIKSMRNLVRELHQHQTYNDQTYVDGHLEKVVLVLKEYGFDSEFWELVGLGHDLFEDCEVDQSEFELEYGIAVYDTIEAVSGYGETRRERNACIYEKLEVNPAGCILKLADRIINVINGTERHAAMYWKENDKFVSVIKPFVPSKMLERLFKEFKVRGYYRI